MKKSITIVALIAFGLSGCTNPTNLLPTNNSQTTQHNEAPTTVKKTKYQETMRDVASGIQNDSKYQRIALDTSEKKEWFRTLTYRLWDRQITRYQFMSEGLSKYPTHQYEFDFIIRGFSNH